MNSTLEIPLNARMIIIEEVFGDEELIETEDYFYNYSGADDTCDYSLNTTAWD